MDSVYDGNYDFQVGAVALALMAIIGLAWLAILIYTIVTIVKSDNYSTAGKTGWIMVLLPFPFMPLLAVILWLFWARNESGAPDREPPSAVQPPQPQSGIAYEPQSFSRGED